MKVVLSQSERRSKRTATASFLLVLLATLASPGLAQESPPLTYYSGVSTTVLDLQRVPDGKLFLTVIVEGRPLSLFVDTGATTILDCKIAKDLGLVLKETNDVATGLTGVAGKRQITTVDMVLGGLRITDQPVSCLDLSESRRLNAQIGWPQLDGLIGSDLLAMLRARIDYSRKTLTLRRPDARSFAEEKKLLGQWTNSRR
jgi:predicted aspartyl protease